MLVVTINFHRHEVESYYRIFEQREIDEEEEEEPRQPRVNYARIPPAVSDQPNVFLQPRVLTQGEVDNIFSTGNETEHQQESPILYTFGEKPFTALEASKNGDGQKKLIYRKKNEKKGNSLRTDGSRIKKVIKKGNTTRCKKHQVYHRMTRSEQSLPRLRNRVLSSSGLCARNKPRETSTKKKQTRAQKLGSSCAQSNKPSVTTHSSRQLKSNKTVRGSANCTKKAERTTKTTKSVAGSTRVLRSHK